MAKAGIKKTNFLGFAWKLLKRPLVIAFVVLGGSLALISALGTLGFNGTTNLKMISFDDWTKFKGKYFDSGAGIKGKPYELAGSIKAPRKTGDNMVYFDKRLVDMLSYLADGPKTKGSCQGWYPSVLSDPRTDKIKLSITSGVDSDLYTPPDNLPSVSTVYRGVGVRLEGMDKIKCTAFYPAPVVGCAKPIPKKFREFNILFDENKNFLDPQPTEPPPLGACYTTCAVNRYPDNPIDEADSEEKFAEIYNPQERFSSPWGNLMPADVFPYTQTAMAQNEGKQAAVYKIAQLAYQIMSIDDAGCFDANGLKGYRKITPYQVIFPEWIKKELENTPTGKGGKEAYVWSDLKRMGSEKYLVDLQKNSPLAGISWDPENSDYFGKTITGRKSNLEVLHINY